MIEYFALKCSGLINQDRIKSISSIIIITLLTLIFCLLGAGAYIGCVRGSILKLREKWCT